MLWVTVNMRPDANTPSRRRQTSECWRTNTGRARHDGRRMRSGSHPQGGDRMSKTSHAEEHVFGRRRPSREGKHRLHLEPKRDTHFRELPDPPGKAPFHLDLKSILPSAEYNAIVKKKRLTFHLNGDMG